MHKRNKRIQSIIACFLLLTFFVPQQAHAFNVYTWLTDWQKSAQAFFSSLKNTNPHALMRDIKETATNHSYVTSSVVAAVVLTPALYFLNRWRKIKPKALPTSKNTEIKKNNHTAQPIAPTPAAAAPKNAELTPVTAIPKEVNYCENYTQNYNTFTIHKQQLIKAIESATEIGHIPDTTTINTQFEVDGNLSEREKKDLNTYINKCKKEIESLASKYTLFFQIKENNEKLKKDFLQKINDNKETLELEKLVETFEKQCLKNTEPLNNRFDEKHLKTITKNFIDDINQQVQEKIATLAYNAQAKNLLREFNSTAKKTNKLEQLKAAFDNYKEQLQSAHSELTMKLQNTDKFFIEDELKKTEQFYKSCVRDININNILLEFATSCEPLKATTIKEFEQASQTLEVLYKGAVEKLGNYKPTDENRSDLKLLLKNHKKLLQKSPGAQAKQNLENENYASTCLESGVRKTIENTIEIHGYNYHQNEPAAERKRLETICEIFGLQPNNIKTDTYETILKQIITYHLTTIQAGAEAYYTVESKQTTTPDSPNKRATYKKLDNILTFLYTQSFLERAHCAQHKGAGFTEGTICIDKSSPCAQFIMQACRISQEKTTGYHKPDKALFGRFKQANFSTIKDKLHITLKTDASSPTLAGQALSTMNSMLTKATHSLRNKVASRTNFIERCDDTAQNNIDVNDQDKSSFKNELYANYQNAFKEFMKDNGYILTADKNEENEHLTEVTYPPLSMIYAFACKVNETLENTNVDVDLLKDRQNFVKRIAHQYPDITQRHSSEIIIDERTFIDSWAEQNHKKTTLYQFCKLYTVTRNDNRQIAELVKLIPAVLDSISNERVKKYFESVHQTQELNPWKQQSTSVDIELTSEQQKQYNDGIENLYNTYKEQCNKLSLSPAPMHAIFNQTFCNQFKSNAPQDSVGKIPNEEIQKYINEYVQKSWNTNRALAAFKFALTITAQPMIEAIKQKGLEQCAIVQKTKAELATVEARAVEAEGECISSEAIKSANAIRTTKPQIKQAIYTATQKAQKYVAIKKEFLTALKNA